MVIHPQQLRNSTSLIAPSAALAPDIDFLNRDDIRSVTRTHTPNPARSTPCINTATPLRVVGHNPQLVGRTPSSQGRNIIGQRPPIQIMKNSPAQIARPEIIGPR